VYVAAFVLAIPALFFVLRLPADEQHRAGGQEPPPRVTLSDFARGLVEFVRNRRLLGTSLVEMATYFAFGVLETYLPLYLSGLHIPAYQIGILFSLQILSITLTKPLFGKLADTIDRRIQILAGIVLLCGATAAIPFVSEFFVLTLVSVLFGLAVSISTVATSSYVAEVVKTQQIGASLGGLSSLMDIGHSSGPFVAGFVIEALSLKAGFLTAALVCLIASVLFAPLLMRGTR
jgi:MFS family permease